MDIVRLALDDHGNPIRVLKIDDVRSIPFPTTGTVTGRVFGANPTVATTDTSLAADALEYILDQWFRRYGLSLMNLLKRFMAMFKASKPMPPRGRVDPYNGNIVGPGAMKAVEHFKDVKVKAEDDPAERSPRLWETARTIISRYGVDWREHLDRSSSERVDKILASLGTAADLASRALDEAEDARLAGDILTEMERIYLLNEILRSGEVTVH